MLIDKPLPKEAIKPITAVYDNNNKFIGFWTLNPTKLEPFQKKREMEAKEQATALDTLAWSVGSYVVDAMAIFLGRNAPAYPSQPRSMNSTEDAPPGAKMTDADRFAAFAAEHNKRLRQRREK